MEKKASYILSTYSFISTHSTEDLLDVGYQIRNGNPIPSFDENLLIDLCSETQQVFEKEDNILEIEGDFIVVGDIHGSLHDLLRILKFIIESKSKALFLGDYIDRGNFSLECITLLFALKVMYPETVYLLRGNHEFDSICRQYGFKNEILNYNNPYKFEDNLLGDCYSSEKNNDCYEYTESLYKAFIQAFAYLPIGAIVNKTTFCVHGGLSPKLDLIDDINKKIKRPIYSFEENDLLADLLWSDPSSRTNYSFDENPRGYGYLFNGDAVNNFLKANSLNQIIRAHQCVLKGFQSNFCEKCVTVFSVSSYGSFMGNSSAIIQLFQEGDSIKASAFAPLRQLLKSEAFYYKVQMLDQNKINNRVCISLLRPQVMKCNQASRMIPNKNNKPIKMNKGIKTNYSNLIASPLARPKFVTNGRKSHQYLKNSALIKSSSSNNYNAQVIINDENNLKYNMIDTLQ